MRVLSVARKELNVAREVILVKSISWVVEGIDRFMKITYRVQMMCGWGRFRN